MSDNDKPLTGRRTIAEWLASPVGGPLLRGLLAQGGQSEDALAPVLQLPLENIVAMSQGAFPQEAVDGLVRAANDGELVVDEPEPLVGGARFENKRVIVTGAASGIGKATAERILREGGTVVAVDLVADRLEVLAAAWPQGSVIPVAGDIADSDDVERIVAAAGGTVHGLANVAGIMDGMLPLHEVTDEVWARVQSVNVDGSFKLMRAVIPLFLEAGAGAIVNVASEASLRGNAAGTSYTVSKHAVVGLTKSAAFLYGRSGIRVNAVAPGPTATGIEGSFTSEFAAEKLRPFMALIPPVTDADTLAASIAWLLSDDSANVNGVILPSDGGWHVQ